jgi:hypothetical protein
MGISKQIQLDRARLTAMRRTIECNQKMLRLKQTWIVKWRSIMATGVKHYFKNGTEYKGATHKDAKGKVMSGKTHTASSKYLFHKKDLPTSATKKA